MADYVHMTFIPRGTARFVIHNGNDKHVLGIGSKERELDTLSIHLTDEELEELATLIQEFLQNRPAVEE